MLEIPIVYIRGGFGNALIHNNSRVVKKLGRAVGTILSSSESAAAGHMVSGSLDLLRPIEGGANS